MVAKVYLLLHRCGFEKGNLKSITCGVVCVAYRLDWVTKSKITLWTWMDLPDRE
jgi:hypothetical protein